MGKTLPTTLSNQISKLTFLSALQHIFGVLFTIPIMAVYVLCAFRLRMIDGDISGRADPSTWAFVALHDWGSFCCAGINHVRWAAPRDWKTDKRTASSYHMLMRNDDTLFNGLFTIISAGLGLLTLVLDKRSNAVQAVFLLVASLLLTVVSFVKAAYVRWDVPFSSIISSC